MNIKATKFDPTKRVILTKLSETRPGLVEVGFWVKGDIFIGRSPVEGEALLMSIVNTARDCYIGSSFNTSKISRIIPTLHGLVLITLNSVWLMENC